MCGIAGIVSQNPGIVNSQSLQKMTQALAHRGPDGEAFWFNNSNKAGFGHRRLSIIDKTDAAAQPMHYLNRFTIVYNGEIYNYIELKEILAGHGYKFRTASDTEVILAAFAHWGKDCVLQFDGMFSFAIWDEMEQTLFAARDRFGEKPFYYITQEDGSSFWFASEMKAFYKGGFKKNINERMLLLFLTNGYTSSPADPSLTFDHRISQLPPANYLEFSLKGEESSLTITQYWDINRQAELVFTEDHLTDAFLSELSSSVKMRFRSDVPVGTSLSGGIDSASIAFIASSVTNPSNSYKCFSAVFPGFEKDESKYSTTIARQFGLQQFTTSPRAEDLYADLATFLYHQDEPVGSASVYAQYKVYELARQHGVTVLLDGQGADELLGGYSKYLHWYLQELVRRSPFNMRKELRKIRSNNHGLNWGWKNYAAAYFPLQAANSLEKKVVNRIRMNSEVTNEFREANFDRTMISKPVVTKLNDILYHNTMQWGLPDLLRYADRNSMAFGREVRLPFLSEKLVEFCFAIPSHFKIRDGFSKWVLRQAMDQKLPSEIVWRKEKVGFEPPQKQWMNDDGVQQLIRHAKEKLISQRILKPSAAEKKIQPRDSLAADNYDWWYLSAGLPAGV